jgi:hypothetical protein
MAIERNRIANAKEEAEQGQGIFALDMEVDVHLCWRSIALWSLGPSCNA